MANTTLLAIREALEQTIIGLSPGGKPLGRNKYSRAGATFRWDERPAKDVDRHFTVGYIDEGEPQSFGVVSDVEYTGEFTVTIGHKITGNEQDSLDRCNTDCSQLRDNLEKESNFPTSVWIIRFVDRAEELEDDRIISFLRFRCMHSRALP
jgi:hypothetical protein